MDNNSIDLDALKKVDLNTVDRETLKDIRDVKIDMSLPREERIMDFINQIGNPYCYRCGKVVVKVSFADTDVTLEERIEQYLKTL